MTAISQQGEVILEVGGEGGGYTILGEQHLGKWRFWREQGDGDSWMWDDDDGVASDLLPSPDSTPEPTIKYHYTLDEALETLNSCWPILYPVAVHPAVAAQVMGKVEAYVQSHKDLDKRGHYSKWKALCLGK